MRILDMEIKEVPDIHTIHRKPVSGVKTPELATQIQSWCGFSYLVFLN